MVCSNAQLMTTPPQEAADTPLEETGGREERGAEEDVQGQSMENVKFG